MTYEGDVKINPSDDGGEIDIRSGQPVMDQGLSTAVYLSLFTSAYWGNAITESESEKMISELESVYDMPLSNQARLDAEEYAIDALQWLIDDGIAESVDVEATIPARGYLQLNITITEIDGTLTESNYTLNWQAQREAMGVL